MRCPGAVLAWLACVGLTVEAPAAERLQALAAEDGGQGGGAGRSVFPSEAWETRSPGQVGLSGTVLNGLRTYLGGSGTVVRHGYLAYTWGDEEERSDVASAAKPIYAHFLLQAVEDGTLTLDSLVRMRAPCIDALNAGLGFKDRAITFRHMANQVSCYGVSERPGHAFDYNDWQMALLWDTLFLEVWGASYSTVDAAVLRPRLSSVLRFQDAPTFLAFGSGDRPGRVAISPRDLARFGLLYLRRGNWNGMRVLSEELALTAVTRPLPPGLPRTSAVEAQMCPGARTLGSLEIPDDQYDHDGGYSWTWWVNGAGADGGRLWPNADTSAFAAIGHDGKHGLAVLPCLDLVLSWSRATARPMNEVFRRLYEAASAAPGAPPAAVGPALGLGKTPAGEVRLVWTGDEGAPRTAGEHYHVLRGTDPLGLDLVPGTHPWAETEFTEVPGGSPLVFYRVVAAGACEQME